MPYYIGTTPPGYREIFYRSQRPTRENTDGRYARCIGPLTLIGAYYLQYRMDIGNPEIPKMTGAQLEAEALADQDTRWQDILLTITSQDDDIAALEAAEYNPDLHDAGFPAYASAEVCHV
jgi:hypothetical protein